MMKKKIIRFLCWCVCVCIVSVTAFLLFTFHLLFIKEVSSLWLELHLAKQDSSQGEGNGIKKEVCKTPFNGL